ncbi:DUF1707 SHOCT-like domain-containing protein [Glycomyces tenuis]|uniref:DUF1707 SHOCT-like domain-containing protein n=1 Tax=Glycomyces tenuis TaxID=58116 RepID=UPI0003FB04E9|nr:DUF1707 domain-containing protein [Glycomyces tenuis]
MNDDRGRLRISNADRDGAIEQLQKALDEGRIDLAEFDERSKTAYEAKTNAELDLIFADLPTARADGKAVQRAETAAEDAEPVAAAEADEGLRFSGMMRALIWVACTTVPIWLFVMIDTGETQGFWPLWPLISLGGIAVAQRLAGDRKRA